MSQVIGWENIELISDRPLEIMLDDFARLKQEFPDRQALYSQLGHARQAVSPILSMCESLESSNASQYYASHARLEDHCLKVAKAKAT